jgi:hypothetical protein
MQNQHMILCRAYYGANSFKDVAKKKLQSTFISPINNLRNNLAVRMRAIQPLAPSDLYYYMMNLMGGRTNLYQQL